MGDGMTPVEKAVAFGPGRGLVGVWCESLDRGQGQALPTVVLMNSGIIHHCGVWRLHTRLARALANEGFSSLRFDLSGIGDSAPTSGVTSLDASVAADISAALQFVRERTGQPNVVLFGLCSGARDAIEGALAHAAVVGAIPVDLIGDFRNWRHVLAHYGPRLLDARRWRSRLARRSGAASRVLRSKERSGGESGAGDMSIGVRSPLPADSLSKKVEALLARGVHFLFVFSAGLENNYNHRGQFAEVLPGPARHPHLRCEFLPDADHTFSDREQQAGLIRLLTDWMAATFGPSDSEVEVGVVVEAGWEHVG